MNKQKSMKRLRVLLFCTSCMMFTGCDRQTEFMEGDPSDNFQEEASWSAEVQSEEAIDRKKEINDYLLVRKTEYLDSGEISVDTQYSYYETGAYKFEEMTLPFAGLESAHIYVNYGEPQSYNTPAIAVVYGNNIGENYVEDKGYYRVTYDENWRLIKQELLDLQLQNVEETYACQYDDNGNKIAEITEGDEYCITTTYTYDEYNVMTSKTEYTTTSKTSGSGTYTYDYEYDKNGLPMVRYEYLDHKYNSATKITRNNLNLITKEETTDQNGKKTVTEYESYLKEDYVKMFYSEDGILNDTTEIYQKNSDKQGNHTQYVESAKALFESILQGQNELYLDDLSCDGTINVFREDPTEENNYASFSIAGRGFSAFYDTDCYEVDGNSYFFYQDSTLGGTYFKIVVYEGEIYIYYLNPFNEGSYDMCGWISNSEKVVSAEEAQESAKQLFSRIKGTYENTGYSGTITIREEEPYGANSYASYALEGVGIYTLYDTWCSSVANGKEYYFELFDVCYKIVDGEEIVIYVGDSKDNCFNICAVIGQKITFTDIEPYLLAGEYRNEKNTNLSFIMNMYSDYVEIGDQVGNIIIGNESGLVYWEEKNRLGVLFESGSSIDMKVYERDGSIIVEIIGNNEYTGTYILVEQYLS